MGQGRDEACLTVEAFTVEKGDILANIGVVVTRTEVGVFTVFGVRGSVYNLSDGTIHLHTFDVIRHSHEEVVLLKV